MSTVMRPVGPLEPRVYWIRRAVLLGVILIVILLVATQCGGGGGAAPKKSGSTKPNPTNTTTTSTTAKPTVGSCDPSTLTVAVSTDTTTYTPGQAPTLIATLSNPTTSTCRLTRAVNNEVWTIKSGTPTVWTTAGCSADPVGASVKVAAGATKAIKTMWNGHLRGADCKDGAAAQPGTYRLYATIDGVKAANPAIFHIIQ